MASRSIQSTDGISLDLDRHAHAEGLWLLVLPWQGRNANDQVIPIGILWAVAIASRFVVLPIDPHTVEHKAIVLPPVVQFLAIERVPTILGEPSRFEPTGPGSEDTDTARNNLEIGPADPVGSSTVAERRAIAGLLGCFQQWLSEPAGMSEHRPNRTATARARRQAGCVVSARCPLSRHGRLATVFGDREPVPPLATVFSEILKTVDQNGRRRRENCGICRRNPPVLPVRIDASRRVRRYARPDACNRYTRHFPRERYNRAGRYNRRKFLKSYPRQDRNYSSDSLFCVRTHASWQA